MIFIKNYILQNTSIWKFPNRGSWKTHNSNFRGNWSPHIPRNLILKYSQENDFVLDMFLGGGTTLIETKLLNRNGIGIDINPKSIEISKAMLDFQIDNLTTQTLLNEDCRNTSLKNNSVDLICMHPPYSNIIKYSENINGDLSLLEFTSFLDEWDKVAKESNRVLKNNKICAYMIGDIRKNGNVIPLGFKSMEIFIDNGFILKEIIIKEQFNCKSTKYWSEKSKQFRFYLLAHEYIFIFVKNYHL